MSCSVLTTIVSTTWLSSPPVKPSRYNGHIFLLGFHHDAHPPLCTIQPHPPIPPPTPLPHQSSSLSPPTLTHPRRQLRLMKPRLRIIRRRLPISTAHLARDWRTPRQVRAAVAAVEDVFHRPLGWRGGGEDGEVGFCPGEFLWVEGLVGLVGFVSHFCFLGFWLGFGVWKIKGG